MMSFENKPLDTADKICIEELNKYKSAVENSPSTILITSLDGTIEYVNPQFTEITGFTYEEAIGKNPRILKSGRHSDKYYKSMWDTINSGRVWKSEFLNKKKNGGLYWESAAIAPIFNNDGNITNFVAIKEDITEKKVIEEQLQTNEEKYRKIFEQFADLYFKTDLKGIILNLSPSVFSLTGYTEEELIGKPVFTVYQNPEDRKGLIKTLLSEKKVNNYELKLVTKNGDVRDVSLNALFEYNVNGKPEFVTGTIHDITYLKQVETKLKELNNTKDKFFSIIAHDLKNPIGSFRQVTEALSNDYDGFSEDDRKEFIESMKHSANQLFELLENLLTWSRSQRDKIVFEPSANDIFYIINNNISLLKVQAGNKKITLENDSIEGTFGYFDANMISTVIRNLISNSIKFAPEGGRIQIGSEVKDNFLEVWIKDSGIGISEEDKLKLFRIDVSLSTKGTANESGTGLGLILCKEFVAKNGGEINVESEIGKGTKFYFTLPLPN